MKHSARQWLVAVMLEVVVATPTMAQGDAASAVGDPWERARLNAVQASEALTRCDRYVRGWLAHADPETGLIPRNITRDATIWNAQDSAADNYPFMVLTTWFTDQGMFDGRMHQMLRTETALTSRVGRIPDTWSFETDGFASEEVNLGRVIFGGSEYVKDGLLPLTEWLGPSAWSERMIGILEDIWVHAPVETTYGNLPSTNVEVNGEMLQALCRVYWMTGDARFLEWAMRLGDYYLLGDHHPTRDLRTLRLRDHGCEIVAGLSELYVTCHYARQDKAATYREPMHAMLDRILEVGTNEHGMLYNSIDPVAGEVKNDGIADTWGYNYNAFYALWLVDGIERYREAVLRVMSNLDHYRSYAWEGSSSDGYADSIESGINLYNRERMGSVGEWIDSEIQIMFGKQREDGVIEGWHGDGNFARTAIMYALWKTRGCSVTNWRRDVEVGAAQAGEVLLVSVRSEEPWEGVLRFDRPRHETFMHLPIDYPRINQFPEWFVVDAEGEYEVQIGAADVSRHLGAELLEGLALSVDAESEVRVRVLRVGD